MSLTRKWYELVSTSYYFLHKRDGHYYAIADTNAGNMTVEISMADYYLGRFIQLFRGKAVIEMS